MILSQLLHQLLSLLIGMLVELLLVRKLHILRDIEQELANKHVIYKVKQTCLDCLVEDIVNFH